jgi:hypothetical protein
VRAMTTLNRQASALARWHDILVFSGFNEELQSRFRQLGVEMPKLEPARTPKSFREAAINAETEETRTSIPVGQPNLNENLVAACYAAVLRLEGEGYYSKYHLVLGENLWRALHQPTPGSLVLPANGYSRY